MKNINKKQSFLKVDKHIEIHSHNILYLEQ